MGYYYLNSAKKNPSYQEDKSSIEPSGSEKKEKNFIKNKEALANPQALNQFKNLKELSY